MFLPEPQTESWCADQGRGLRVTRSVARGELLFTANADAVHESTTHSVRLGGKHDGESFDGLLLQSCIAGPGRSHP